MRKYLLLFLWLGGGAAPAVQALELTDLDLSVKTGIISGSLSNSSNKGVPYGGIPLMLGYNLDVTRNLTLSVDMSFVLDANSFQITRTGFEFCGSYHLFGGARRLSHVYGNIETIGYARYDISLGVRTGFQHYSAASDDLIVTGNVFETMIGVQYRQEITDNSALSIEFFISALGLSASTEQLKSSQTLTLISWRFFL